LLRDYSVTLATNTVVYFVIWLPVLFER